MISGGGIRVALHTLAQGQSLQETDLDVLCVDEVVKTVFSVRTVAVARSPVAVVKTVSVRTVALARSPVAKGHYWSNVPRGHNTNADQL